MVHPPRLELGIIVPKTIVISTSLWVQRSAVYFMHFNFKDGIHKEEEGFMYKDEQILSVNEYEKIAKAYADALKKKRLKIVHSEDFFDERLVESIFEKFSIIKACLFALGGFMNTSSFYSLNERQMKKFNIIFDTYSFPHKTAPFRDKTKCFISFISNEFSLINDLIKIAEQSSFEEEIKNMTTQRLSIISSLLAL